MDCPWAGFGTGFELFVDGAQGISVLRWVTSKTRRRCARRARRSSRWTPLETLGNLRGLRCTVRGLSVQQVQLGVRRSRFRVAPERVRRTACAGRWRWWAGTPSKKFGAQEKSLQLGLALDDSESEWLASVEAKSAPDRLGSYAIARLSARSASFCELVRRRVTDSGGEAMRKRCSEPGRRGARRWRRASRSSAYETESYWLAWWAPSRPGQRS